jgi:hypothetical protein
MGTHPFFKLPKALTQVKKLAQTRACGALPVGLLDRQPPVSYDPSTGEAAGERPSMALFASSISLGYLRRFDRRLGGNFLIPNGL